MATQLNPDRLDREQSGGPTDFEPVAVVYALRREAMFFRRWFVPETSVKDAPCPIRRGRVGPRPVMLVETGVGVGAVEAALSWLFGVDGFLGSGTRATVLSVGFSGALSSELRLGDLAAGSEVINEQGGSWATTWMPKHGTPARLFAADRLVSSPGEKKEIGLRYGAGAVDMESGAVARICSRHGIRFGCLRAISDDCETSLSPCLSNLLRQGRVTPTALAAVVIRHPWIVRELTRLARDTRRAGDRLSAVLGIILGDGRRGG